METDMVSREYQTKQKRLLAILVFISLCLVDLWKFFSRIDFSPVHLWTASLIFLYLIWFYRFYLNNPEPGLNILGVEIDKSVFFLFSILIIKLLFQIYLYNKGLIFFTGDTSYRTTLAYKWSLRPHLIPFCGQARMPFYKYSHGLLFMLVDDVLWAPRFTGFLASCLLLIYFYKFIRCIFPQRYVCYLSTLILLFYPWYVWVSGSPMLETYYLAFLVCGFYYITVWLKKDKIMYLLLSSVFFILSSGFHFPSWPVINSVNLFMLYFLVIFYRQKDCRRVKRLVLFFFLNNLWIIVYVLGTFYDTGTINVLKRYTQTAMALFIWRNLSISSKLAYYPGLVVRNGSFIMWALLLVGIFYIIKNRKNILEMFPLFVAAISLIGFSIFNLLAPPSAPVPDRFCLVFVILLIPYMAYGFNHIFSWGGPGPANKTNRQNIGAVRFFSVSLFGFILFLNISGSLDFLTGFAESHFTGFPKPKSSFLSFRDQVNAGAYINNLFNTSKLKTDSKFMIEHVLDYVHILLTARHHEQTIYDRKHIGLVKREAVPSILREPLTEVKEYLLAKNVKYVIVKSKDLKERFEKLSFALKQKTFGDWTIYKIDISQTK